MATGPRGPGWVPGPLQGRTNKHSHRYSLRWEPPGWHEGLQSVIHSEGNARVLEVGPVHVRQLGAGGTYRVSLIPEVAFVGFTNDYKLEWRTTIDGQTGAPANIVRADELLLEDTKLTYTESADMTIPPAPGVYSIEVVACGDAGHNYFNRRNVDTADGPQEAYNMIRYRVVDPLIELTGLPTTVINGETYATVSAGQTYEVTMRVTGYDGQPANNISWYDDNDLVNDWTEKNPEIHDTTPNSFSKVRDWTAPGQTGEHTITVQLDLFGEFVRTTMKVKVN